MEGAAVEEAEVSGAEEFAPALVAAHPLGHSVAVAVGPELRLFDLKAGCAVSLSDDSGGGSHSDAIRAISFSVDGALFASAGDDKLVKIWKTDSWCCIRTIYSRVSLSGGISPISLSAVVFKHCSLNGVMLLTCDLIAKKLSFLKVITMEKSYIPTSLASSFSSDLLWTVMGASNMPNQVASQLLTRLRIIPCFQKDLLASSDQGPAILEDSEVPHGDKLLLALQGSLDIAKQEEVLASVLPALKVSMHKMLAKKNYSEERREQRKRCRNDKKIKK